ncbi:hypothetical protein K474DRAFT_291374 [Panus rudis PR-1116 ss-1]|nr:hypothetical protein K474DRAFT_291374 [Panus rudis PR-1116 ss-1]
MQKLQYRQSLNHLYKDIALVHFLSVLRWFRRVILQDLALAYTSTPYALIFRYAPFDTPLFHAFATSAVETVCAAEKSAEIALRSLPEQYAQTFQGLLVKMNVENAEHRCQFEQSYQAGMSDITDKFLSSVEAMKEDLKVSRSSRKRKTATGKSIPIR